jgi:hypothetical protein
MNQYGITREGMDAALQSLVASKDKWARTSVNDRIDLLQELIEITPRIAQRWVAAGVHVKHLPDVGIGAAQEWITGPYTIVRNLRRLQWALHDIQTRGKPKIPGPITTHPDGQVVCRVIPHKGDDRIFFPGISAEVWMQPGVTLKDLPDTQAEAYQCKYDEGKIVLVLGAGNVSGIAPTDALYKLFVENEVVLLKTSPVNDYIGPLLEEWFHALIEPGFLRIVAGGPEEGSYLCNDRRVYGIHVTGSDKTYNSIVFGTGADGIKRKTEHNPLLNKPVTGELGNVCPAIVVPGPWSEGDIKYHAELIASAMNDNGGFTCSIPRLIVQHAGWKQRNQFLDQLRKVLNQEPLRYAYYPGASETQRVFVTRHPEAEFFGEPKSGQLPWTMVAGLNPEKKDDICFTTEPFFNFIGETALDAPNAAAFIDRAVEFANKTLWGTLTAVMIVHPKSLKEKNTAAALDRAKANLRYGTIAINFIAGANFVAGTTPWGPFPNDNLFDIQSGNGFVHNTLMFSKPQKTIFQAPFHLKPKPIWFNSRGIAAQKTFKKLVDFEVDPSPWKVPGILWSALRD